MKDIQVQDVRVWTEDQGGVWCEVLVDTWCRFSLTRQVRVVFVNMMGMRGGWRSFVAEVNEVDAKGRDGVSKARELMQTVSRYSVAMKPDQPRVMYLRAVSADNCASEQVAIEVITDGLMMGVTVTGDTQVVGGVSLADLRRARPASEDVETEVEVEAWDGEAEEVSQFCDSYPIGNGGGETGEQAGRGGWDRWG